MSHELRTPMNAILGFGQLLEYDALLAADQQDSVHEILKAGRHLLELINEVLDLAKVESGRIDLSLEPVELCVVVASASAGAAAGRCARHPLSHEGAAGGRVRADRTRLKQVLLNLLSNAIKYNREGGTCVSRCAAVGGRAAHPRDRHRPGIPAERIEELFQPFNRLGAEASDIEGTGIGLTITRRWSR
jgi:signal transduction histidine kinase